VREAARYLRQEGKRCRRSLATVTDDEIGGALEQLWGEAAVNTWNARRASVLSPCARGSTSGA
jgi:hypothetical protein